MQKKNEKRLPLLDIYQASFLTLKGIPPELVLDGTRVIFEFPITDEVYNFNREYNSNPSVPVLDFVKAVRQLKAMMLSMKRGGVQ